MLSYLPDELYRKIYSYIYEDVIQSINNMIVMRRRDCNKLFISENYKKIKS
jgi:hypothetical protein